MGDFTQNVKFHMLQIYAFFGCQISQVLNWGVYKLTNIIFMAKTPSTIF